MDPLSGWPEGTGADSLVVGAIADTPIAIGASPLVSKDDIVARAIAEVDDPAPVGVGIVPNPGGNGNISTAELGRRCLDPLAGHIVGSLGAGIQIDGVTNLPRHESRGIVDGTIPAFVTGVCGRGGTSVFVEFIIILQLAALGVGACRGNDDGRIFRPGRPGGISSGDPGEIDLRGFHSGNGYGQGTDRMAAQLDGIGPVEGCGATVLIAPIQDDGRVFPAVVGNRDVDFCGGQLEVGDSGWVELGLLEGRKGIEGLHIGPNWIAAAVGHGETVKVGGVGGEALEFLGEVPEPEGAYSEAAVPSTGICPAVRRAEVHLYIDILRVS